MSRARRLLSILRSLLPDLTVRIRHTERNATLRVRLRQNLGLIIRGAAAYESRYVRLIRLCAGADDVVFDVGANIGFYSVLFAHWAQRVVCYEPDPDNVALLARNLADNGCDNASVRPIALSDRARVSAFRRDLVTGQTGHLGIERTYSETTFFRARAQSIVVTTATLDAEVQALKLAPDVLKLDVEGYECEVLRGGRRTLTDHQPLVVSELSTWGSGNASERSRAAAAAVELLRDLGYSLWDLDTGRTVVVGRTWMLLGVPTIRIRQPKVDRVLAAFRQTGNRQ